MQLSNPFKSRVVGCVVAAGVLVSPVPSGWG